MTNTSVCVCQFRLVNAQSTMLQLDAMEHTHLSFDIRTIPRKELNIYKVEKHTYVRTYLYTVSGLAILLDTIEYTVK
jgi:hypothetical protein